MPKTKKLWIFIRHYHFSLSLIPIFILKQLFLSFYKSRFTFFGFLMSGRTNSRRFLHFFWRIPNIFSCSQRASWEVINSFDLLMLWNRNLHCKSSGKFELFVLRCMKNERLRGETNKVKKVKWIKVSMR